MHVGSTVATSLTQLLQTLFGVFGDLINFEAARKAPRWDKVSLKKSFT